MVGLVYLFRGAGGLRALGFPFGYLLFALPLPSQLIGPLTGPLRVAIAAGAVDLLGAAGLPVAHQGVYIFVDQYEILMKAACSGLATMISLSALGLFYVHAAHDGDWRRILICAPVIVLAALIANFARVLAIILITHIWGDAAGQGFLHEGAGLLTLLVALLAVIAIDGGIDRLGGAGRARHG